MWWNYACIFMYMVNVHTCIYMRYVVCYLYVCSITMKGDSAGVLEECLVCTRCFKSLSKELHTALYNQLHIVN